MYKKFGKTDLMTSQLVYGCWGLSGAFGAQDERDSLEALRTAYDEGINFFDAAEVYGAGYSEQLLGRALGDIRDKIIISTKVSPGHLAPAELQAACERSLKNLNTSYIDLYLIHWPSREIPLAETIGALQQLQSAGKIRYYGVSNFGRNDLTSALELGTVSADQLGYNLLFRAIEDEILPLCQEKNVPVMAYSSLMQGLLSGKYKNLGQFPEGRKDTRFFDSRKHHCPQHNEHGAEAEVDNALEQIQQIVESCALSMPELAVGWLKAQAGVGGILVGTRNAEQSRNLRKLIGVKLDAHLLESLTQATNELKSKLGTNPDMWDYRIK